MSEYTGEVLTERPKIAPAGSNPPIGMAAVPAIEEKFKDEYDAKKATLRKDYEEEKEEITTTSPFTLPGLLTSPTALVTGGALLALGTGYAAGRYGPQAIDKVKGAYKSVKERMMSKGPEPIRIDPIGFESFADMTPTPTTAPAPNPLGQTNLTPEDIQARAAQLKAPVASSAPPTIAELDAAFAAQTKAAMTPAPGAPSVPPQFAPGPVSPAGDIPPAPPYQPSTPFSAAPPGAPAPESSASPNSSTTSIVNNTVKEMIDEVDNYPKELRTGTGKPAFAGMGPAVALNKKGQPKFKSEYADINAVPRDYAFVPGADKIDTLRNTLGQQAYTEAFTNRPFPSTNEMAIQQASEINRMLGRPTRAELIAAGKTPAANTPGITQPTNPPKGSGLGTKTAKVGGVLGALIAIPDLAKAETAGQRGMAGANLLEAVLPPGFMMGGAGEGSGSVPSVDAAMLLGSPYAQSPLAVKRRQEQEYVRKVGAGRGIAPPSAYQR